MGIRLEGEQIDEQAATQTETTPERELSDAELDAEHNEPNEGGEEASEALITIGDPPADTAAANGEGNQETQAPEWAKQLRKDYRRIQRELADERRKNAAAAPAPVESTMPKLKEPTLENCNWDEAEYKKQYAAYLKEQHEIDQRLEDQRKAVARQQDEEKALRTSYRTAAGKLGVQDFDEAEDAVCATLSEVQQNILLSGCDNPAVVVYALGKNPGKAEELAKLTNPVKFAVALGKLEKEIKVTPRKPNTKPAPEQIPTRTASLSGGGNTALEAARKRAEQTGDYTEVNRIKRAQRAASRGN